MRAYNLVSGALAVLLAVTSVALASGPHSISDGQAKRADHALERRLVTLQGAVEQCFAVTRDYTRCDSRANLVGPGAQFPGLGTKPGQVTVRAPSMTTYVLTGLSRSGTRFRITRLLADVHQTCSPAGRGTCRPDGSW